MGRNQNEHLEGLLVQKDQEIAALESQVQAYIAKTSILQSRLLSALDTLDVIQSSQHKELDTVVQLNKRLKDKLHRYNAIVKTAELERDDMRDAVLRLVEKVELSNDYSMLPHSQIRLSSLADDPLFQSTIVQASESDLLLHATTMIETLRKERDFEREAHAQTRDVAQAQILSLKAQLSRREAELETFISDASRITPHRTVDPLIHKPLTSEQVISALDATVARNKTLEIEIKGLFKRLEDARIAASSSKSPPPPSTDFQHRREIQRPLKPFISTLNTIFQSTSVVEEPTACQCSQPNNGDPPLVMPDHATQPIEYLEHQVKALGAKVDAFSEARRSVKQALPMGRHEGVSYSVEERLESLESENYHLRLSERGLRDELDVVRISAQARETELLDEIHSLQLNQQGAFDEPNSVLNLLEPDNGEISMELATPLLPIRVMLDVNSPHINSPAPHLDRPLPPSPDDHLISSSPASSQIMISDRITHHERPDSPVNDMENLTKTMHPP